MRNFSVLFCFSWISGGHDLDLPHSAAKLVSTIEELVENLEDSYEEEALQSSIMK